MHSVDLERAGRVRPLRKKRRSGPTRAAVAIGRFVAVFALVGAAPLQAVVISEIHYNPGAGDEVLEFVELMNDTSTPEDLSGWAFVEGIHYVFPKPTVLPGRGVLVVCADADALKDRYGITNAIGNYSGKLDASGERLTLVNQAGIVIQSVRFRDEGQWPAIPDGSGHTLSLLSPYLDCSEPESWTASAEIGGTPGAANFSSSGPRYVDTPVVPKGALWRYAKGTAAFSDPPDAWRSPSFDDGGWAEGAAGIGFGDGDDATVLADMQNVYPTVAMRRRFQLSAEALAAAGEFQLAVDYDDGFCAWVNGVEVARSNCGSPGQELAFNAVATGSREAGTDEFFVIPRARLVAGENVVAVVGHNFTLNSSDFSIHPHIVLRQEITAGSGGLVPVVFNELFRAGSPGDSWFELHNLGGSSVDLGGFIIKDGPADETPFTVPAGTSIPGRGYLALAASATGLELSTPEVRLYLIGPDGKCAAAAVFDRALPEAQAGTPFSELRFPDGSMEAWIGTTPTRAAPNQIDRVQDLVINEIFYHPPDDRKGEFIELHNRGDSPIDASGFRFTRGIDFTIPPNVVVPAGGFLVICEDPALLQASHGIAGALGPWTGRLADDGENIRLEDRLGNLVDEVRYHDGGDWPEWADGGGASLELIDPRHDNDVGSAWDSSDESSKTQWEQLSFTVPAMVVSGETELHLYLVERGICRVDDFSLLLNGAGNNFIPNPGFETNTTPWRIDGTHVRSRRITEDKHSGVACLEVNASAKGDTLVNRIETDTSPRLSAGRYEVSLWARWVRGASLMVVHGEYHAGPYRLSSGPSNNISGNSMSAALRMTIPRNLGTPGAENSARAGLRSATGSDNLGPTIDAVVHSPIIPKPAQPPQISARVADPDGIVSVSAFYRLGSPAGEFQQAALSEGSGGLYTGSLPSFNAGNKVVFYIEAIDRVGALRRYPVDAPARTCVFQVENFTQPRLDAHSVVMDDRATQELGSRLLHSNDLVPGSFVFNDREVYYNIGVRYRGSPWGRPGVNSYRVRFPDDKPFHRGMRAENLSSRGASPNEGSCYFLVGRNSGSGEKAPTADHHWITGRLNGASRGTMAAIETFDRRFVERWYGEEFDGPLLKAVGRLLFNDAGQRIAWEGASSAYRDASKENYRGYWTHSLNQGRDDYAGLIQLFRVMDTGPTPNAMFDSQIGQVLDVEAFFRVLGPRILQADWDAVFVGNGHNGYLALDTIEGLWKLLPFDMDNTFGDPNASLFPAGDPNIVRMMTRPMPRRVYFRVLDEYTKGYWWSSGAGPFLDQLQRDAGLGTSGIKGYLDTSRNRVISTLRTPTTAAFKIVTNGGNNISTAENRIELEGTAAVQIATILYQNGDDEPVLLDPAWTRETQWKAGFALPYRANRFEFSGFDAAGNLAGTASITVENTSVGGGPVLMVSEWFPMTGPAAGGTRVSLAGSGFTREMAVFFGGVAAMSFEYIAPELVYVTTPPAPANLAANRQVVVSLVAGEARLSLPEPFVYEPELGVQFVRGDSNGDGKLDISDPVATLGYLFLGGGMNCADAADFNDDGDLVLSDAVALLDFLFRAGRAPAAPYPTAGADPTPSDALDCAKE
jgi:hypothetical protein